MNGQSITVSFGVTEIQPGDTPETMLRRADRALLMAKENGRNQVVQLGSGLDATTEKRAQDTAAAKNDGVVIQQTLITPVPTKMAIEKLRGFVADHGARIVKIDGNQIQLDIAENPRASSGDLRIAPSPFISTCGSKSSGYGGNVATAMSAVAECCRHVFSLRLHRGSAATAAAADVAEKAQQVLVSLRSYLMANSEDQEARRRTTRW